MDKNILSYYLFIKFYTHTHILFLTFFNVYPANTRRCFDEFATSFKRFGRQMDVETTLCAYCVQTKKSDFIEHQ